MHNYLIIKRHDLNKIYDEQKKILVKNIKKTIESFGKKIGNTFFKIITT